MTTKIFTPDKLKEYIERRLFGKNVSPSDVSRIELHNSVLPLELSEHISRSYGDFVQVEQENGREPLFFREGTLFIPQYSGLSRARRYKRMIEEYQSVSDRKFKFVINYHNGSKRRALINYSNLAYDFVTGMFMPDEEGKEYDKYRVFPNHDIKDVRNIIFGSPKAVAKQAPVIERGQSQYLECQIVDINGQKVLNIGDVYGDQAQTIVEKMQREYAAIALSEGHFEVNFYVFSRVGSLDHEKGRGSILYPVGVIDSSRLDDLEVTPDRVQNCLASNSRWKGVLLNCPTVIDETIEQLQIAADKGCAGVELEIRRFNKAVTNAHDDYTGLLNVNSGYALYVSDCPLYGDTLADEMISDSGEQNALDSIVREIKGN